MTRWLLALPALFWPRSSSSPRLPSPDFQIIVHFYFCLMLAAEWPSALYSSSRVPSFLHRGVVPSRLFFRGFPATHRPNFRVSGRQPPREKEGSREDMLVLCGVVLGIFNYKGNRWLFFHVFPLLLAVGYCSSSKLNFICVLLSSNVVIYTFV